MKRVERRMLGRNLVLLEITHAASTGPPWRRSLKITRRSRLGLRAPWAALGPSTFLSPSSLFLCWN